MSLWITKVLMAFYVALFFSTWWEGRGLWPLYWLGAFLISIPVYIGMKGAKP